MRTGIALTALLVGALVAAAGAAEVEYPIASWENTMNHFGTDVNFDAVGFDTIDGVTAGTYSLMLDLKAGWQHGLRTAYVDGLEPEFAPFFPQLGGASTKVRLDVTTSSTLANVPMNGGIQLALYVQGQSGDGSPYFANTYSYNLVGGVYTPSTTTETMEWDLTKNADGATVGLLPNFSAATGGWFEMRIFTNAWGGTGDPGIIFLDNFRSVKQAGTGAGDFNGNGEVEIADYTTWADHFGMAKSQYLTLGSFVTDGSIGIEDYTTWADNFGRDYDGPGVPEPTTMALLGLGALVAARRKAQR